MEIIDYLVTVDPSDDEKRVPFGPTARRNENGLFMVTPLKGMHGEGKVMRIDPRDYAELDLHFKKLILQAKGYPEFNQDGKHYSIHRQIYGITNPKVFIDHISGDKTDNRRSNLRVVTNQQNQWNSKIRKDNTTGYKGVRPKGKKFEANIRIEPKNYYLGRFKTKHEAAIAYNYAAKLLRGEYAALNENIDMSEISEERRIEIEEQIYERLKKYI